jgi:3-polyprenyl-4-hydroxybenzoate decarboxylase
MKNNSADLRSFLLTLQIDNELVTVKGDVNTEYDIAAVSARLDGKQNQSTHRLLRLDEHHMAIRMVEGRHLHKCFTYARDHGEDLKIAIGIPPTQLQSNMQSPQGVKQIETLL